MAQSYGNEITTPAATQFVSAQCLGAENVSRRRQAIYDVADRIVGESVITPPIYIEDVITQMRAAPALSLSQRYQRLKKASQLYKKASLAGLSPAMYSDLVMKVTGLSQTVVSQSLENIADGLTHMRDILQAATPAGAVWMSSSPAFTTGCSLFSRRGDVVSVITAGNGPGVHGLWPQAIAMGYRTLVRPSTREPFTAQRLVCALTEAGLENYVALIPTDYKGAETLIARSDFSIVYGGPKIAARYGNNPRVLVQGPGRSKMVIGKDVCHDETVAVAADSVLSLGGAACVATSAILVEEDAKGFAKRLRQVLATRSQQRALPLARKQEAEAYEKLLQLDDIPWRYERNTSEGVLLKPHVALVESAACQSVQRELPFPCVTIAPFNAQDGCKALSGSLVVTVLSRQKKLINKVMEDATIANVYVGSIPTTWMDYRVPHDGYLADFLMCNRGVKIETGFFYGDDF